MNAKHTGETMPANRQKAKPPPATTTHHNRVYTVNTHRVEENNNSDSTTHMTHTTGRRSKLTIDGTTYERVRRGARDHEVVPDRERCPDCGALEGEYHRLDGGVCDAEICPKCNTQLLSCDCEVNVS